MEEAVNLSCGRLLMMMIHQCPEQASQCQRPAAEEDVPAGLNPCSYYKRRRYRLKDNIKPDVG